MITLARLTKDVTQNLKKLLLDLLVYFLQKRNITSNCFNLDIVIVVSSNPLHVVRYEKSRLQRGELWIVTRGFV